MLFDQFDRHHNYLRVSLTDRCNFKCFYCMPEGTVNCMPRPQLMTPDEIHEIVKTFVSLGIQKIRITGGEPLVRNEAAMIIRKLGSLDAELAITTNGYLIDRYLTVFKESGLKNINISLDSLDSDRFKAITKRDVLQIIFDNIRLFSRHGFHLKINSVITRNVNDDELLDFVEWSRKMPVHIRFIEFMPFAGNNWDSNKMVSYSEILDRIKIRFPVQKLQDGPNETAKNYKVQDGLGTFAVISSVTQPFCDTCNRLRVMADGKMKNCLFANESTDLLTALREGKDITPLIRQCVKSKAFAQGGQELNQHQQNASMVKLGG